MRFWRWAKAEGVTNLATLRPRHIGAFVRHMETCTYDSRRRYDVKTVKLTLAAVRAYFRYLVEHDVLHANPAREVKGPRHSYREGQTPVISVGEERRILDAVPLTSNGKPDLVGLRDRALLAVMMFTCARVGAVLKLDGKDVCNEQGVLKVKLSEKNSKRHIVPCSARLRAYLDAYIRELSARRNYHPDLPLFRAFVRGPHQALSERRLSYQSAYALVQKYAKAAGIETHISNHTFRASGITAFLTNGGDLYKAQCIANHASVDTTRLYDRRESQIDAEEMERVRI